LQACDARSSVKQHAATRSTSDANSAGRLAPLLTATVNQRTTWPRPGHRIVPSTHTIQWHSRTLASLQVAHSSSKLRTPRLDTSLDKATGLAFSAGQAESSHATRAAALVAMPQHSITKGAGASRLHVHRSTNTAGRRISPRCSSHSPAVTTPSHHWRGIEELQHSPNNPALKHT